MQEQRAILETNESPHFSGSLTVQSGLVWRRALTGPTSGADWRSYPVLDFTYLDDFQLKINRKVIKTNNKHLYNQIKLNSSSFVLIFPWTGLCLPPSNCTSSYQLFGALELWVTEAEGRVIPVWVGIVIVVIISSEPSTLLLLCSFLLRSAEHRGEEELELHLKIIIIFLTIIDWNQECKTKDHKS